VTAPAQCTGQAALLDEALQRVEEHADPDWKTLAYEVLVDLCRTGDEWTTDDFWLRMRLRHPDVTTHEPRALGALIRRLLRDGMAEKTGRFGESTRPEAHRAIVFYYRRPIAA
jgi:hypothetical protein